MSILIKGMKMPEKCGSCDLFHVESPMHCTVVKGHKTVGAPYGMPRPDWCPLVEIPEPHGRLIDVDAYCEDLLEEAHRVWGLLKPETIERINRTVDDLKNYPAVVEAEGSENHDD